MVDWEWACIGSGSTVAGGGALDWTVTHRWWYGTLCGGSGGGHGKRAGARPSAAAAAMTAPVPCAWLNIAATIRISGQTSACSHMRRASEACSAACAGSLQTARVIIVMRSRAETRCWDGCEKQGPTNARLSSK